MSAMLSSSELLAARGVPYAIGPAGYPRLRITRKVKLLPIAFFEVYLLITVLLFAFGPWPWPVSNPAQLYTFLAVCHLALGVGYWAAVKRQRSVEITSGLPKPERMVYFSVLTCLCLFLPTLFVRTGGQVDILAGLLDPGTAYLTTRMAVRNSSRNYTEYVRMLVSPLIWSTYPLTMVFWRRLSRPLRFAAVAAILGEAIVYVAIGTNKGLVDIALLAPWLLLLRSRDPQRMLRFRRVVATSLLVLIAAYAFLLFLERGMNGRAGGTYSPIMDLGHGRVIIVDRSDESAIPAWPAVTGYITQGYYGLSLALTEPFVWTYGFGHSRVLGWIAEKLVFGEDTLWNRTYISRAAERYGWHREIRWHSIYPWIASDVSFWGTPLVVFAIGYLFGKSWLDSLGGNPYAIVVFSLLAIALYYMSANNQVEQASDTVVVFWAFLVIWLRTRRTRRRRISAHRESWALSS